MQKLKLILLASLLATSTAMAGGSSPGTSEPTINCYDLDNKPLYNIRVSQCPKLNKN